MTVMFRGVLPILVFAPATVALVVLSTRRLPAAAYWASMLGIVGLVLLIFGQLQLAAATFVGGPLIFGTAFVVVPTLAAFLAGRLIRAQRGGAYIFTLSSAAYLLALGAMLAMGSVLGAFGP